MNNKWALFLSFLSLAGILFLMNLILFNKITTHNCNCTNVISYNYLFIFIILSLIFISFLYYYLFSLKLNQKKKIIENDFKIIYSILEPLEQKLFDLLLISGGSLPQSEISKKFGKLKGHRLINKLLDKNIVTKKKKGLKNKIIINTNLMHNIK